MKKSKGFTLIELVVVMALIAILALMIVGAIIAARRMTTETKHRNNGKAIQVGMEKYYAANKQYPTIAAGTSFSTAAQTLQLGDAPNYGLDTTPECSDAAAKAGGGQVVSTSTGFTIEPFNYVCLTALGDQYKNPQ